MDEQISEICRRVGIKDYLEARGHQFIKSGKQWKCICPLPGHPNDSDPSFNVTTLASGIEVFKCFGCGEGGSIITLIHLVEGAKKGEVINRLSQQTGIKLSGLPGAKAEPLMQEILEVFCDEDDAVDDAAVRVVRMFEEMDCPDAVARVSRLYQRMDELCDLGHKDGVSEILRKIGDVADSYCDRRKEHGKKKEGRKADPGS